MRALPRVFILVVILACLLAPSARPAAAASRLPSASSMRRGSGKPNSAAQATAVPPDPATPEVLPTFAVVTSTPRADGSIVHIIQYGQTLTDIASAYGISLDDLRAQNKLTNDAIMTGDPLIIRPANTPTPVYTPTLTLTPTRKPTSTRKPPTATHTPAPAATRAPAPTATQTVAPLSIFSGRLTNQKIGIGLVVICAVGLLVVGLAFFKK